MNQDKFWSAYEAGLLRAVTEGMGGGYCYGPELVPSVVAKMRRAVETQGSVARVDYRAPGFRLACKALGIPFNRAGLDGYLFGEVAR